MSPEEIKRAATKAGRANAVAAGRPELPWLPEDRAAATAELHRLARLHHVELFALPRKRGT